MENSFPHRIFCIAYLLCHFCGQLSTEIAESCALRSNAVPTARAKRKGHLRFPFLFELLPFPCLLVWRRLPTCDRFEKEYGRGFFLPYLSQPVRSVRYRSATHVISSAQARHTRVAQHFNALYRTAPANLGVWYNLSSQALSIITRSRIARHGYAAPCADEITCVAVRYL